ncbi:hypothetical protein [Yokenella regensburgei]|uniref:hypothetical protein n=1 Tax=Yokenella regensburgei TaxID=158877 RepID=UPI0020774458|nr:hypothetical protein [Yokenella regensburgei]
MPVWLDEIPERHAGPSRPRTRRWLLFLLAVMLTGIALTLWQWEAERSGFVFWFSALGLPFFCWGVLFSSRRLGYKMEQVGADAFNLRRQAQIENETLCGQRRVWVLDTVVQTSSGNTPNELLTAVSRAVPSTSLTAPRRGASPVRYAALGSIHENLAVELQVAVTGVVTRMASVVEQIPASLTCWLQLECDGDIEPLVQEEMMQRLAKACDRTVHLFSGKGATGLDRWLDKHWETPGVLLVASFSFPELPEEGSADAITMLALCNRRLAAFRHARALSRPEKSSEERLVTSLQRALLWAKKTPEALHGAWISGPLLESGSGWHKACEENGVAFSLTTQNTCIDPALGYAGPAALWLTVALANAAFTEPGAQVVAAQSAADKDDIWVAVITQEHVAKEPQGNV